MGCWRVGIRYSWRRPSPKGQVPIVIFIFINCGFIFDISLSFWRWISQSNLLSWIVGWTSLRLPSPRTSLPGFLRPLFPRPPFCYWFWSWRIWRRRCYFWAGCERTHPMVLIVSHWWTICRVHTRICIEFFWRWSIWLYCFVCWVWTRSIVTWGRLWLSRWTPRSLLTGRVSHGISSTRITDSYLRVCERVWWCWPGWITAWFLWGWYSMGFWNYRWFADLLGGGVTFLEVEEEVEGELSVEGCGDGVGQELVLVDVQLLGWGGHWIIFIKIKSKGATLYRLCMILP